VPSAATGTGVGTCACSGEESIHRATGTFAIATVLNTTMAAKNGKAAGCSERIAPTNPVEVPMDAG
jgi:hypothetical protein